MPIEISYHNKELLMLYRDIFVKLSSSKLILSMSELSERLQVLVKALQFIQCVLLEFKSKFYLQFNFIPINFKFKFMTNK